MNIFQGQYSENAAPIRISYHRGNHYNSLKHLYSENKKDLHDMKPTEKPEASVNTESKPAASGTLTPYKLMCVHKV